MCSCDPPEFYSETMPRSRKERKCEECDQPIAAGERYIRISGRWDGLFGSCALCLECRAAADEFHQYTDCCWSIGDLSEDIGEFVAECPGDIPPAMLAFGQRIKAPWITGAQA